MINHSVDNNLFEYLRERYSQSLASGTIKDFDENIIETVKLINQIPNVCSVFSCSGHMDFEDEYMPGYLMCVAKEESSGKLYQLFKELINVFPDLHLEFELGRALDVFCSDIVDGNYYNCISFRVYSLKDEKAIQDFWATFNQLILNQIKGEINGI